MPTARSETLRDLLVTSVNKYARLPCVGFFEKQPLSYGELGRAAARFSRALAAQGLEKGDRVALVSENRPEWVVAYFGIVASGYVAVPILMDFPAEQVCNIIAHAECSAIAVSDRLSQKISAELRQARFPIDGLGKREPGDESGFDASAAFPPLSGDDLAVIIYTSGTTGHSKGVMHRHYALAANVESSRRVQPIGVGDRFLSVLPLAHTYECTIGMLGPIMNGARIDYLEKPPTASVLLPALKSVRPQFMLTVPLIIEKIYRASVKPKLDAMKAYRIPFLRPLLEYLAGIKLKKTFGGRLKFFGIGGAALSEDVERFLRSAKFPYAIGYGLTETAPLIAGAPPSRTRFRSTGPAVSGVALRIADPRPDTGEGEIQAKGPNVMLGYYKDPGRTAEVFTGDGWFRTGDLGVMDAKGRVYVRGRLKSVIIGSSGENIYPEEIESLLNQSEHVQDSVVYGDRDGVAALVQLKPEAMEAVAKSKGLIDSTAHAVGEALKGTAQDLERAAGELLESIRKQANAKLSGFSRIIRVKLQVDPFERTPSMKIKRFLYPKDGSVTGTGG